MIDLCADMFVQLALSAKRHKEKEKDTEKVPDIRYNFEHVYRPKPMEKTMPIEETVEEILHNPEVMKLKRELETVEELFGKLKQKGENIDYLIRLESRISRLRQLLDEQSIV